MRRQYVFISVAVCQVLIIHRKEKGMQGSRSDGKKERRKGRKGEREGELDTLLQEN